MPTGLIMVNDPKAHKDLRDSDIAQKPKPDSINAKAHKRATEDNFHTCNRVPNTYTGSKLPKRNDPASGPTLNNKTTIAKKMTDKEIFRDSLNEHMNVEAANLQISNVSEVQSQESAELTNVSCTANSNKNITPFRYNFRDNIFAMNRVVIKEAFREKSDKGVNAEDSNGSYEEHEIKEGIVLKPELLEQLGIDLNKFSAVNNNIEYVLPDVSNWSITDETAYDTGIQSEVNKRNTTVVKGRVLFNGAMQSAGPDIKIEQSPISNPQLLPSEKQDNQPSASEQKPPQHKPKQEKVKQPNLESRQRWNMFPCNLCSLRFPSRPTLNEHRLNHEAFKSFGIRRRARGVKAKKSYMCKFCPRVFPIKELWQLHMKIHKKNRNDNRKNQENLFLCNYCEKYFSNLFELRAHKKRTACFLNAYCLPRKHHSCHVCREEFEDTFDLTLHLRTHGAPLKSYSVRKPKPNSVGAKPHTDTDLSSSVPARNPKQAETVNPTKGQEDRELKDSNLMPPGSVNATNAHKDRNLDSFSAQNPKRTSINATETQLGGRDSINANTHKRATEDKFHTCNRVPKTYTRSKLPKLTDTANCPTASNNEITKKREDFRDSLNERMNVKAANLQSSNVSEVETREKAELTNGSCSADSNKSISPFGYNCQDNTFTINSVAIKEAFREKSDKGVNTEDSNGLYEEHEIKEGIVLRPELLEQLGIDLNKVSAVNNNIEYVLPDTGNWSITDETAYDTGIHSEVNKRNTTVAKAEEPEVDFGEKVSEYGNDVWSNAIVKKEPEELDDKERMMKAIEYDNESMIKTELLRLCKDEVEDESVLGLLLHESQDVASEVQRHKDTAAKNEQNIETVNVKEESAEFIKNISEESKDLVNAALEAAWKELYAEHEAMELALVKIEKDPEITDTMDLTTDIVNKQDTVRVKEEVEVLEDTNITDVVDLTIIENKKDKVNVKEESEVLGDVSGDNDEQFNDIMDENKNPQGIKLDKVHLEVEQAGLYVDHQIKGEIVIGPVRLHQPDVTIVPKKKQTELSDTKDNFTDGDVRLDLAIVKKETEEIAFNKDEKDEPI